MNETRHGKHRRPSSRDEPNRLRRGCKLDGACLHSSHRWAVGHVKALVFGNPTAEHVALTPELLDLALQGGDALFRVPSELGKLMDVALGATLCERSRKRASQGVAQSTELLELDPR